ncbi:MAG: hypothetical protein U5Q16_13040 [Gammaproteobacteria bacterium]|nr:hypothetical protein [Gammaproteobacteria bacterium]
MRSSGVESFIAFFVSFERHKLRSAEAPVLVMLIFGLTPVAIGVRAGGSRAGGSTINATETVEIPADHLKTLTEIHGEESAKWRDAGEL